jgi:hypothetical protein
MLSLNVRPFGCLCFIPTVHVKLWETRYLTCTILLHICTLGLADYFTTPSATEVLKEISLDYCGSWSTDSWFINCRRCRMTWSTGMVPANGSRIQRRSVMFSKVFAKSQGWGKTVNILAIESIQHTVLHLPWWTTASHNTAHAYNESYAIKIARNVTHCSASNTHTQA